jgi:hypothetical protein
MKIKVYQIQYSCYPFFMVKARAPGVKSLLFFFFIGLLSAQAQARVVDTNEVRSDAAPAWVKTPLVDRVVERIQSKLEWDIRKIRLVWHSDQQEFRKAHGFDDSVLAFSRKSDNSVHMGPRVSETNFESVFGHELVHVILFQKYKGAVPKWLEEGLANSLSNHQPLVKNGKVASDQSHWSVDYAWLTAQPSMDVLTLNHPFLGVATQGARYHYQASQALVEMIASHCSLDQLLQLSVGKKLENYLSTFCGIDDVNSEFRKWVAKKAKTL